MNEHVETTIVIYITIMEEASIQTHNVTKCYNKKLYIGVVKHILRWPATELGRIGPMTNDP